MIRRFMGLWTLIVKSLGLVLAHSNLKNRSVLMNALVFCSGVWVMAGERGTFSSRGMLLCKPLNEAIPDLE